MSGGLDSAIAAARLVDEGFDVVGVTLHLWDYPEGAEPGRCCAPEDQYDARRTADELGIPHYTFDRSELFRRDVVEPFVEAYLEGRTPSPCVSCNRSVKLRELFELADRLEASHVATGHYARVVYVDGRPELHRAIDRTKDQSYFLHVLRERELLRLMLPLGGLTKAEVRALADRRGFAVAGKGESQELCFVSSGRYDAFVDERADGRVRPGPILDTNGKVVGRHDGLHRFTIGQRKGLGVALGRPAFVVGIEHDAAAVVVGFEEETQAARAVLDTRSWTRAPDVELPLEATVKVRARHEGAAARIERVDGELRVEFLEPVRSVAPGQVAVAYLGERVVAGATIERVERAGIAASSASLGAEP
jgi:tRNA-specific 2-thiouridylase